MVEVNIPGIGRRKTPIIIFIAWICWKFAKEKLNCLNSHEVRIGKNSRSEKTTLLCNGFTSQRDCDLEMAM